MKHRSAEQLQAAVTKILESPFDGGHVELIVRRPEVGERELLTSAELSIELGLVGDNWHSRGSFKTADGLAHPGMQLTLMSSRVISALAGPKERWPLAGDQLFVDLNLSAENLSPGTRLKVGTAVVEVSAVPHTGCKKFVARFGSAAAKFVGSEMGRRLNFRGINAVVVEPGEVKVAERLWKIPGLTTP
ncbi:MAG: MOSC domain-containing protein [Planctomycetota bacterium]